MIRRRSSAGKSPFASAAASLPRPTLAPWRSTMPSQVDSMNWKRPGGRTCFGFGVRVQAAFNRRFRHQIGKIDPRGATCLGQSLPHVRATVLSPERSVFPNDVSALIAICALCRNLCSRQPRPIARPSCIGPCKQRASWPLTRQTHFGAREIMRRISSARVPIAIGRRTPDTMATS